MKKSVQLSIRASEIRSEINALEPGDATLEKRRELLASLNTVEAEYRAALTDRGRGRGNATAPGANGLTADEREFRELTTKAELRMAFRAVMNGDPLDRAPKGSCKNIVASKRAQYPVGYDWPAPRAPHGRPC